MIDGQRVWEALVKDPDMQAQAYLYPVFQPLVEALPDLLGDLLDQPISVEVLVSARLQFARHMQEMDYPTNAAELLPESDLGWFARDTFRDMYETALDLAIAVAEEFSGSIEEFLEAFGYTEEEFLLSEELGLVASLREQYMRGNLTLADILLEQPGIIVLESIFE